MRNTILFFLLSYSVLISAQNPTFADDVASILWENCATCHHDGSITNSTFLNYQQVFPWASTIKIRINSNDVFVKMPPWPPSQDYQTYAHERVLTSAEITTISDWVDNGTPAGDTANMASPPTFGGGAFIQDPPDLSLTIPTYASKATSGQDDYVCFVLPTGLTSTKHIKAIEVIPGNSEIVHHVIVSKDSSGFATDTIGGDCAGSATGTFISGYAPGSTPMIYPNGNGVKMGARLDPSDNIVLGMHYPEGSFGMKDSTTVNLYFYDDTTSNIREVTVATPIDNFAFCFAANTVDSLEGQYPPSGQGTVPVDITLLSVTPHCHLLGSSFIVYLIGPLGDTTNLIHIPQWNFEWQDFYFFKNPVKIEAGSVLYAKAVYDNTTNNAYNPNNPPQIVCSGGNTSDEMFVVFTSYLPYQNGDEFIDIEALTTLTTSSEKISDNRHNFNFKAYPNPFREHITLSYSLDNNADVSLEIYSIQGQLVKKIMLENQSSGDHILSWNGRSDSGSKLAGGLYLSRLIVGKKSTTKKLILN